MKFFVSSIAGEPKLPDDGTLSCVKAVVVDFDELTSDFSRAIVRLNEKFRTQFVPYFNGTENDQRIFQIVEEMERLDSGGRVRETHVSRPSNYRACRAAKIKKQLQANANYSILTACFDLYRAL